jgi:hypothetical protein
MAKVSPRIVLLANYEGVAPTMNLRLGYPFAFRSLLAASVTLFVHRASQAVEPEVFVEEASPL